MGPTTFPAETQTPMLVHFLVSRTAALHSVTLHNAQCIRVMEPVNALRQW
jgi:hypothetical protein